MGLLISAEDADVRAACARALAADPVGNTIFSSVAGRLVPGRGWCAVAADGSLAARSLPSTPLALSDGWAAIDELAGAVAALASLPVVSGPIAAVSALVARLGREPLSSMPERLFRCDVLERPTRTVAGSARPACEDDRELLVGWWAAFEEEALGVLPPDRETAAAVDSALRGHRVWLWLDPSGAPVAFARRQAAVNGVSRVGPVYTPPFLRARGYGSAVTAAATEDALVNVCTPVLFTDLTNPTSNAIYQRLGYRAVSDHLLVRFPA